MPRETYEQELRGSRAARGSLGSRQRWSTAQSVVELAYEAVVPAGTRMKSSENPPGLPRACFGRNALHVPAEKPGHALEKSSAAKGSGKRSESTAPRIAL